MTFNYTTSKLNQIIQHLELQWLAEKARNDEPKMSITKSRIEELEKAIEKLEVAFKTY